MTYNTGDRIKLRFFPGVHGVVDRIDEKGRVWVTLDKNVLDTPKGTSSPIAEFEMQRIKDS